MNDQDNAILSRLLAEAEIRRLLALYAKAVDRRDWTSLRNVYFPDAQDWHGSYRGGLEGFIDWVSARHASTRRSVHFLGNVHFDWLSPESAFVETYFIALKRQADPDESRTPVCDDVVIGRYLDHFQRRDGTWGIARREVVYDLTQKLAADGSEPPMAGSIGRRDGADPAMAMLAQLRQSEQQ